MTTIGHIQDIVKIPPEISTYELCDCCHINEPCFIFQMDCKHSDDLSLCIVCADRVLQLSKMMSMMEN